MIQLKYNEIKALIQEGNVEYKSVEALSKITIFAFDDQFNVYCEVYKNSDEHIEYLATFASSESSKLKKDYSPAFNSKSLPNGQKLFKRVHGAGSVSIPAGQTGIIDFSVPYTHAKISGAEVFGGNHLDTIDLFILDTDTNTYSGAPIEYPNYLLNQFAFDVNLSPSGQYLSNSNYDADLYQSMVISCAIKNNGTETKIISINFILHEVV
jgi:hypothetical protein